jgi:S-adenosylmethionine:tRNA ribosyltransferase-isomerase
VKAETRPVQRPADARLLVLDSLGMISHRWRREFVDILRSGDVVIANDAATLPASLSGQHAPTGARIEVRLAARRSLSHTDVRDFTAVVFGEGDFRTRTEDRPPPPALRRGDELQLGPIRAFVARVLGHPRLIVLHFAASPPEIWEALSLHGRPIQYSHLQEPLAIWDTWTPIAGPPAAFEPPSAGFALDWNTLAAMAGRGIHFGTITHAAGLSSTGDQALDALLPFDEPYRIPRSTARLIGTARIKGGRVVAIGTTVVRALEDAGSEDGRVRAGEGIATQRIDAGTRLRVVDAVLSGTHEPGSSHYELLRAFADGRALDRADEELNSSGYRTHEFGDSVFIERAELRERSHGEHVGSHTKLCSSYTHSAREGDNCHRWSDTQEWTDPRHSC